MEHNVGKWDKTVRLGVGASFIIMGLPWANATFPSWVGPVLLVLGAILLFTGAFGFCPLYKVFGISTAKVSDQDMKDLMK